MLSRGPSRAWLRALDGRASGRLPLASGLSSGLPPLCLCPAVPPVARWPRRLHHAHHAQQHGLRRSMSSAAEAAGDARQDTRTDETKEAGKEAGKAAEPAPAAETSDNAPDQPGQGQPQRKRPKPPAYPNYGEAKRTLPRQCPGCGAFSQTAHPKQPGYYNMSRHSTLVYLGLKDDRKQRVRTEDLIVQRTLASVDLDALAEQGVHLGDLLPKRPPAPAVDSGEPPPTAAATADLDPVLDPVLTAAPTPTTAHAVATWAPRPPRDQRPVLLCTRCNELVNHNKGVPIYHPGIDAIRETMAESPYKYNHVYHVLDAADFPMSLLPRIHELLDTMPLRSRNRRSARSRFYGNRRTELSFVVTRSDLLSPRAEKVDTLMPWVRETLRDALGRIGRRGVRLGNIHLVSAKRNWWTKELREEIYQRGGATWLVGKANVGKSKLVSDIFPKGRMDAKDAAKETKETVKPLPVEGEETAGEQTGEQTGDNAGQSVEGEEQLAASEEQPVESEERRAESDSLTAQDANRPEHDLPTTTPLTANIVTDLLPDTESDGLDELELLPPCPDEINYPTMPIASALPGTTASPIRIPFGGGKGELIDLPGLVRTRLTDYVQPRHRLSMLMRRRIDPEQVVLKAGKRSLLLGGIIRITPRSENLDFLTYNYTPLSQHCTLTEKAIEIQEQRSTLRVENIALPGIADKIKLAGSFPLKYDVTKTRTGPITRKDAINIPVDKLPYRVVAMDLLIEGSGWIEIVAQVRKRDLYRESTDASGERDGAHETAQTNAPTNAPTNQPDENGILQSLDLSSPDEPRSVEQPEPRSKPEPTKESWPESELEEWTDEPRKHKDDGRADGEAKEDEAEQEEEQDLDWPIIDVYTPEGKFVAARRPLNAWTMNLSKTAAKRHRIVR